MIGAQNHNHHNRLNNHHRTTRYVWDRFIIILIIMMIMIIVIIMMITIIVILTVIRRHGPARDRREYAESARSEQYSQGTLGRQVTDVGGGDYKVDDDYNK